MASSGYYRGVRGNTRIINAGEEGKMAIGEIITCTGPEDLYRRAEDLLQKGIQTEFVARNTMKVVGVNGK